MRACPALFITAPASGQGKTPVTPVYQLDLRMAGENHRRQLLYDAAVAADLIMIEGVMGLIDGEPCSADLAIPETSARLFML